MTFEDHVRAIAQAELEEAQAQEAAFAASNELHRKSDATRKARQEFKSFLDDQVSARIADMPAA